MNTIERNKKKVGKNSKSYDDKHPENPILMGPIHYARIRSGHNGRLHKFFLSIRNYSRPTIMKYIRLQGMI